MSRPFARRAPVPAEVLRRAALPSGARVLASAASSDGTWLLGTRDALVVVEPVETRAIPWEQVETAEWDRDEDLLRVSEVGEFGRSRPVHVFTVAEPGRLLPLVRERVTASVLLQRRVAIGPGRGLLVIARRPPRGTGETTWAYEFDAGVDPGDPAVARAAEEGLRAAQAELGASGQEI